MRFWFAVLFAAVGPALVSPAQSADARSSRATIALPAVGCKTPEAYNEAVRLTQQRSDPSFRPTLRDYLERHRCVGFRKGEVVAVRKSGTFEGGRFIQLLRDPDRRQQQRNGPPIYWTVPEAIGE
jgi:hypothetical protein